MFDLIRSLVLGTLALMPVAAEAVEPCEIISQIVEIDAGIVVGGTSRDFLMHQIASISTRSDWLARALSAQGDGPGYGLGLPVPQRRQLAVTIGRWQQWHAAQQGRARAEEPADMRLTLPVRRSMLHALLGCRRSNNQPGKLESVPPSAAHRAAGNEFRLRRAGPAPALPERRSPDWTDDTLDGGQLRNAGMLALGCLVLVVTAIRMDERGEPRHKLLCAGSLSLGCDGPIRIRFRDLSRTGCGIMLSSAVAVHPGMPCEVGLGGCRMTGRVVWARKRRAGIVFNHPLSHAELAGLLSERRPAGSRLGFAAPGPAE